MDKSLVYKNKILINEIYQLYLISNLDFYCKSELSNLKSLANTCDDIHALKYELLCKIDMTNDLDKKYIR